ncbi:hypothetical protein [Chryseobacterium sp. Hurlbut01]|uniref:hypothetical protein n=1 Tax=Chryseobacterium sp. Hurlbut01 TaxID=1681828 RepID=UPI00067C13D6|nr:hypothetical protein [Chryseobacterium sp. Hurlbut01]KNB61424.1 hypothetical protein AC804_08620 [Chryseobacterium sp. Hurlbut01]
MKLPFKAAVMCLFFISETYYCQSDYSLGITFGSGINFFQNEILIDKNHFSTSKPLSTYFGAKLIKNLDEENKLFADFLVTRKKIHYKYDLNEPDIPFINKENFDKNMIAFHFSLDIESYFQ